MKNALKRIYSFVRSLVDTLVSIICVIFFSRINCNAYFKKQRQSRKDGDACHILCNGPSLSSFLNQDRTICGDLLVVNFFGLTSSFKQLKPRNYIVLDNILRGYAAGTEDEEMVNQLYDSLLSVDWPMNFYYPNNGKKSIIKLLSRNTNIKVCIYNMTPVNGLGCVKHWLFKKSLGMPLPQNISNAAVFCALNSGYKKIYLYGVEHSWLKNFDVDPKTHKIYLNDGHFYQEENIRWFNRGEYRDWLLFVYKAMSSHFELRDYADYLNSTIINKTPASFVEAYEFE